MTETNTDIDTDDLRRFARTELPKWAHAEVVGAADELDALRASANDADELWRHCEMLRRALKAACDDGWADGEGAFDRYVRNAFVGVSAAALSATPAEPEGRPVAAAYDVEVKLAVALDFIATVADMTLSATINAEPARRSIRDEARELHAKLAPPATPAEDGETGNGSYLDDEGVERNATVARTVRDVGTSNDAMERDFYWDHKDVWVYKWANERIVATHPDLPVPAAAPAEGPGEPWPPPDELAANGVDQSIQLPSVLPDAAEIERWAGLNLTPAQASVRFYAAADALRAALAAAPAVPGDEHEREVDPEAVRIPDGWRITTLDRVPVGATYDTNGWEPTGRFTRGPLPSNPDAILVLTPIAEQAAEQESRGRWIYKEDRSTPEGTHSVTIPSRRKPNWLYWNGHGGGGYKVTTDPGLAATFTEADASFLAAKTHGAVLAARPAPAVPQENK